MSPNEDRGRGRATVTALVALVTTLALLPSPPAHAAQKGLNTDLTWGISDADQDRTGAAMRDLGTEWTRIEIDWHWVGTGGFWNGLWTGWTTAQIWSHYDRAVRTALAAGARVLLMVQRTPTQLSGSTKMSAPPLDPGDFATFMQHLAERYRGKAEAYEIWNEPNIAQFWAPGPDPGGYARLLKAGFQAVKAVDPAAKVVFGGLAGNDYRWLESVYAAEPDIDEYFDVMGVHPYVAAGRAPEEVWSDTDGRTAAGSFQGFREVLGVMRRRGSEKPIWLTEMGWATTTEQTSWLGVDERRQAEYLTRAMKVLESHPIVEVAYWYNLRNNFDLADADLWEGQLGLLRSDFTAKPAYAAFKAYVAPGSSSDAPTSPSGELAPGPGAAAPMVPTRARAGAPTPAGGSPRLRVDRVDRRRDGRRVVHLTGRLAAATRVRVVVSGAYRRGSRWVRLRRTLRVRTAQGRFRAALVLPARGRWRAEVVTAATRPKAAFRT